MWAYYLSGPMTGVPQSFIDAAEYLRNCGLRVISPVELDSLNVREAAIASEDGAYVDGQVGGETWGNMLARGVGIILDDAQCAGIILLPGWEKSHGARLEATAAVIYGNRAFYFYDPDGSEGVRLQRTSPFKVLDRISSAQYAAMHLRQKADANSGLTV